MATRKAAPKKKTARTRAAPDFSKLPAECLTHADRWICLACVLDVFTRHLGLAAKTAYAEVARYTPTIEEITAHVPARPFFAPQNPKSPCPNCGSAPKWHAHLHVYRIESGSATDAPRRELIESLPATGNPFAVLEENATQQSAFFEWLEKIAGQFDLDDPVWLREVSLHYLSRKYPDTDWTALFAQAHSLRRSRHLSPPRPEAVSEPSASSSSSATENWELENARLFLAPVLFDELLAVQYLVSRSHKAGGLTFEGRYTLPELIARLRNGGYLRGVGIAAHGPSDTLEAILAHLGGGDAPFKFYYIVDRRDLASKAKAIKDVKPPRPKPPAPFSRPAARPG